VVIKFKALRRLLTPAKWIEQIAKSTETPGCPRVEDKGGYKVQEVPKP